MRLIKLLHRSSDKDVLGVSRGDTAWRLGEKVYARTQQADPYLSSSTVIHAYQTIAQAMFFCESHNYNACDGVFYAEGDPVVESFDKVGCRSLFITRPASWPYWFEFNRNARAKFMAVVAALVLREATLMDTEKQAACSRLVRALVHPDQEIDDECGAFKESLMLLDLYTTVLDCVAHRHGSGYIRVSTETVLRTYPISTERFLVLLDEAHRLCSRKDYKGEDWCNYD